MKLNLEATTKEQELIKAYLEENASETLAEKINNGTPFQKDGKTFINRKTLDGFMNYASNEARKLASKGANSACVEDKVVYGWAMHYFEEDSVEGTLFNADGSTYQKQPAPQHKPAPKPQPAPQISMFELMEENKSGADEQEQEELSQEEKREILQELAEKEAGKSQLSPLWQKYTQIQDKYPDAIILMRIGDFYEVLGDNARMLGEELDLTITSREVGLKNRIPMIGFPFHAADTYIKKILARGYKVAVAEPDDDLKVLPPNDDSLDEELTEEEMREFDGDIEEADIIDDEDDKDMISVLQRLLDNKLIVR